MGTAMAMNENGSLLGVITAATRQMTTIAGRLQRRQVVLGTTPASWRNTTTSGYMKTTPNTTHIATYKVMYREGEKRGTIPGPLTSISQVSALGNTRIAVVTPPA